MDVINLPLKSLKASRFQPRSTFNEESLLELAKSFEEHGVLQPILVKQQKDKDFYVIIAGERRYRAACLANLSHIPCLIMDIDDKKALSVALIENIQREDLNAIEEAIAYQRLCQELSLSVSDLAIKLGKDRSSIINTMRLLKLSCELQSLVVKKELSFGHARALIGLKPDDLAYMIAQKIIREGLSVRKTESLVRSLALHSLSVKKNKPQINSSMEEEVRQKLQEKLGTKVILKKENKGYWVNLYFSSSRHLNDLLDKLDIEL